MPDLLLAEMASDSGSTSDSLDNLKDNQLDSISRLASTAANLEQKIQQTEDLLKKTKADLHKITNEKLPELLETMGLQKFTLTDGSEISVKPIYAASIPKDRKAEAFKWLRDHEFGDLVKNNVSVTFGRGEDEDAAFLIKKIGEAGFSASQAEKVEPMTLKAWLRERVEAGDPVPLDLFGAFISQRATIKRSMR
jgi:hypothetical protein